MRIHTLLVLGALVLSSHSPSFAQGDFERQWPQALSQLRRGVVRGDEAEIRAAKAICLAAPASLPAAQQSLVAYTIAYADYRLAFSRGGTPAAQAALLDEAETQLIHAIGIRESFADAHALLASVLGARIRFVPAQAQVLAERSVSAMDRASSLEAGNARVLLLRGMSLYNTPAEYGGSVEGAVVQLKQALDRFAAQPADLPWPNWGRLDAHAWLGQALARRGDTAGARTQYEQALRLEPEYAWVKLTLLPALGRKQHE